MKNVSEAAARLLKPFRIGVAHKPALTIRQRVMKPKDPLPMTEQSAVVYSIPCQDCDARYVGETGRRLGTRLHEHQLAINRKDELSLVYGHVQQQNHVFAFEKARVIGRANDKMARLMLESWSSTGTLNRAMELSDAYQALRTRLTSAQNVSTRRVKEHTQDRLPTPTADVTTHSCDRESASNKQQEQLSHEGESYQHAVSVRPEIAGAASDQRTSGGAGGGMQNAQQLIDPTSDKGEADKHVKRAQEMTQPTNGQWAHAHTHAHADVLISRLTDGLSNSRLVEEQAQSSDDGS